jgi:hypothetical protein
MLGFGLIDLAADRLTVHVGGIVDWRGKSDQRIELARRVELTYKDRHITLS